jgi:hypothetical protein
MEIVTIVFAVLTGIFAGVAYQLWLRNLNYRQRIFELTDGQECSNLLRVTTLSPPPPPPPKETTITALMELDCKRMDEWRDELCNHYRTDLTDVSTAWHVCKLDEEGKAIFPINIPADIAVKFFGRMSNHLNRKLARHKENMKKGPDRFEYDCEYFNAVIENGTVTVKDKETGETYVRT